MDSLRRLPWLLAVLLAAGCAGPGPPEPVPLFQDDFAAGDLAGWEPTDPRAWRIEEGEGGRVLSLVGKSAYQPPFRSPLSLILRRGFRPGSFVLEVLLKSTTKEYPHRDLCLVFGWQDPAHFYYVHLASAADPHAHSIFAVDGAPRVAIAARRDGGIAWGDGWHRVRLERDAGTGRIAVFLDGQEEPIMEAADRRFGEGRIGLGSFDDTGQFADLVVRPLAAGAQGPGSSR